MSRRSMWYVLHTRPVAPFVADPNPGEDEGRAFALHLRTRSVDSLPRDWPGGRAAYLLLVIQTLRADVVIFTPDLVDAALTTALISLARRYFAQGEVNWMPHDRYQNSPYASYKGWAVLGPEGEIVPWSPPPARGLGTSPCWPRGPGHGSLGAGCGPREGRRVTRIVLVLPRHLQ